MLSPHSCTLLPEALWARLSKGWEWGKKGTCPSHTTFPDSLECGSHWYLGGHQHPGGKSPGRRLNPPGIRLFTCPQSLTSQPWNSEGYLSPVAQDHVRGGLYLPEVSPGSIWPRRSLSGLREMVYHPDAAVPSHCIIAVG